MLLLPLGISLLLLAAAVRWPRRWLTAIPLMILGTLSTPFVGDRLLRSLEDQYRYVSLADSPSADAVFVFGGMLGPRDRADDGVAWNDAAERFERATQIVKLGKAGMLVFSGGPERYPGGPDEGELLKREAVSRGVPEASILVTKATWNTRSEADILCDLAAQRRWQRVLLVTSAYHMPRVMRLSRTCTAERIAIPIAFQTSDPSTSWAESRIEDYLPQAAGLLHSELALREYLGVLFYRGIRNR
jgi:uncharacterized SAM-binding protein YcdF (DUF218 family)